MKEETKLKKKIEKIVEAISEPDYERPILGKWGVVEGYRRDLSLEKLATYLAAPHRI